MFKVKKYKSHNTITEAYILEFSIIIVHNPDAQHQLLCIVIIENAVQIISKTKVDFL